MRIGTILMLWLAPFVLQAQQSSFERFFKAAELHIDTSVYTWDAHQVVWKGKPQWAFEYRDESPVIVFHFSPKSIRAIEQLKLMPSGDFDIIDSLLLVNDEHYRLKLRFRNISQSAFLQLSMEINSIYSRTPQLLEIPLFPTNRTEVSFRPSTDKLFIGEERVFELQANHLDNIREVTKWQSGGDISYRLLRDQNRLLLHLLPERVGEQELSLDVQTKQPYLDEEGRPRFTLPTLRQVFTIKPAKLVFLNVKPGEVVLAEDKRGQGIEMELDFDSGLQLEKTYRLEAQEQPGGALIGELFTRRALGSGKILCWLRLYDYHRRSQGYLYIKDGDHAKFITNFNIVPEVKAERISLQREGEDWKPGQKLFPGERIGIRIEGQELRRARISFEGLQQVQQDTVASTDEALVFWAQVPLDVLQRKIQVFNRNQPTGLSMSIKEYQRPRPLDFVMIQYGRHELGPNEADRLIFVNENIDDISLVFHESLIDSGRLHGPQYLKVDIEIRAKNNELLDQKTLPSFTICPDESSPRSGFYKGYNCQAFDISLNRYLRKKIYDLDTWSSISITIRHDEDSYDRGEGYSRSSEFVLFRKSSFDIDVSFPAGLLTKRISDPGFGNLGGISMAMIAQFSFYRDKKIANAKPYKFGAGFLAFNAFNFNENNDNRDVGLVVLASLYPIRTRESSRLSFPLFLGGGYFLSDQEWFFLLGPGIRLSL